MTDVVGKLWGFCHVLRHDGVDYGDYIEQLTYLLFIKMADERGVDLPGTRIGRSCASTAARSCSTPTLSRCDSWQTVRHPGRHLQRARRAASAIRSISRN
jgi:type I restriction enzyme M protein